MTSFSVVSLIAIVPESECRMPTFMVSCEAAGNDAPSIMAPPNIADIAPRLLILPKLMGQPLEAGRIAVNTSARRMPTGAVDFKYMYLNSYYTAFRSLPPT